MAEYGLTAQGFVAKPLDVVKTEMEADYRDAYGQNAPLGPNTVWGNQIGIESELISNIWDLIEAVHSARNPANAEDQQLDQVSAITGTYREKAAASTALLSFTGIPTTAIGTGAVASVTGTGVRFETTEDATLAAADAWAPSTAYVVGDIVENDGNIYVCDDPGTSAGSGGPTGDDAGIVDGGVIWDFVGEGEGYATAAAKAQEAGAKLGAAGTITVIETPVAGWLGVNNIEDADVGAPAETNSELRARREAELVPRGSSAIEAIRLALLNKELIEGVTTALVFQNVTMITDSNGLPAKSVEALVQGGDDQEIREVLWRIVGGGIETYGTENGTVVDSMGITQTVKFSRPTAVDVYVHANIIRDPNQFPADGDTLVKQAIADRGNARPVGYDVVASALVPGPFTVPGVLEVEILISLAPSPTLPTTIVLDIRELGEYDTARITTSYSDGEP